MSNGEGDAQRTGDGAPGTLPARLIVAGNVSVDVLLGTLQPWPTPGTEVLVDRSTWRVGGALGNTAMALADLGTPTHLVWDTGDDMLGRWLAERLATAGDPPRVLAEATSLTVALNHPDGERTFLTHLGHLERSDPGPLAAAIDTARPGDLLLVGGSFLLPRWRSALPDLLARARRRGVATALDTGWPTDGWNAAVRAELRATLAHVDLFLPNLDEARGLLGEPQADARTVLVGLRELVAGRTALKLGSQGAALLEAGAVVAEPAPTTHVHDTVGAGDTFNALFLCALHDGLGDGAALRCAVHGTSRALASTPRRLPRWEALRRDVDAAADAVGKPHLQAAR